MNILKKIIKHILALEARLVLSKYKPTVIALMGSVGKTSTKDAVYLVLSSRYFVRKSEKSFTTELGVPLTILGCSYGSGTFLHWLHNMYIGLSLLVSKKSYPQVLVLEINSDKPGDLKSIGSWLSPHIIVINAIGEVPAHVELFGGVEESLHEKKVFLRSLSSSGTVVFNVDDPLVRSLVEGMEASQIACGTGEGAHISGSPFTILYGGKGETIPTGMSFSIAVSEEKYICTMLGSIGVNNEYAFLLACGVGEVMGISLKDSIEACSKYTSLPGRMNLVSGIHDSIIIDDSYNSSPIAAAQALLTFSRINTRGKKIAVIGDMLELGRYSVEEHKKLADMLKEIAQVVVCVGLRSKEIERELRAKGFPPLNIFWTDTSLVAGDVVRDIISTHDLVLVKGSQTMRMERVVESIMRHPQDKKELLVRQDPEWLVRP